MFTMLYSARLAVMTSQATSSVFAGDAMKMHTIRSFRSADLKQSSGTGYRKINRSNFKERRDVRFILPSFRGG